jgi:fructose-1,6-bisphosphatase-3
MILTAHPPFLSLEDTVLKEEDVESEIILKEKVFSRKLVGDTDTGVILRENVNELEMLLKAYRDGVIPERS